MHNETVNLSALVEMIAREHRERQSERQVEFVIAEGLIARGDPGLLRIMLENLLGNAWKFTGKHQNAKIEFGAAQHDGKSAFNIGIIRVAKMADNMRITGNTAWLEKNDCLYETIRDGIVATDMGGRILECNQAYVDMLCMWRLNLKAPASGWLSSSALFSAMVAISGLKMKWIKEQLFILRFEIKEDKDLIQGYTLGAISYIRKPIDFFKQNKAVQQLTRNSYCDIKQYPFFKTLKLVRSCRLNHIFERYSKARTRAVRRNYTKCFGSIEDN